MQKFKVIVMVLSADIHGYDVLIRSIRDTWAKFKPTNYEVLYYYGYRTGYPQPEKDSAIIHQDCIICGLQESIPNINLKNFLAFKCLYDNFDFDYVFRCCAGSYVHLDNIERYVTITKLPTTQLYCGVIGTVGCVQFASGSGFFMSRDVVKLLVDNPSGFFYHPSDDVAIGQFLTSNGVKIRPGERQDLFDITTINRDHYHYHFRHNTTMMYAVHAAFGR